MYAVKDRYGSICRVVEWYIWIVDIDQGRVSLGDPRIWRCERVEEKYP